MINTTKVNMFFDLTNIFLIFFYSIFCGFFYGYFFITFRIFKRNSALIITVFLMKKILALFCFLVFSLTFVYANVMDDVATDTVQINKLNSEGYQLRRSDAEQTIAHATKALKLAKQINYTL